MEDQFQELVVKPLGSQPSLMSSGTRKPSAHQEVSDRSRKLLGTAALVIIDGLDECGDEDTQKRVLSTIRSAFEDSTSFPLRFLICSRPESWLQHTFSAQPLRSLHECVILDDSFEPNKDIERYYRHHFQEIVNDPEYTQVHFPSPWPSEEDLDSLMRLTGDQFVYAVTAVKFIRGRFILPTEQLQVVLRKTPPRCLGMSPFTQLDALYEHIVSFNPHYEDVSLILAAILVIPSYLRSPACLELVLGLPKGQVALTLRGMHSVLDIRGFNDEICLFHNSFGEYLLDPTRSGAFYIDKNAWIHTIARIWLQNLSTMKIRGYSPDQLWDQRNMPFFTKWKEICASIPEPTRDLLDVLWDIDLATTLAISGYEQKQWKEYYEGLVSWVRKYRYSRLDENDEPSEPGDHAKAGKDRLFEGSSYNNGQCGVTVPVNREIDDKWSRGDGLGLVEDLVHKFQNWPSSFHLEWPPGGSPSDNLVYWIVNHATGCPYITRLDRSRPSAVDNVRLTDCRCDLSGGHEPCDPWHLAYQEACWKLVGAYISRFEELSQSGDEEDGLTRIFMNLTESSLLRHCRLDMELLSGCQKFLKLAEGCLVLRISYYMGFGKVAENMFEWFETFPDRFAAEGEALRAQLFGLPWEQWSRNYSEVFGY